MFQRKSAYDLEWEKLMKKEAGFLQTRKQQKDSVLNRKLAEKIPEKLQDTLDKAFAAAFGIVFDKGTEIIEKTYQKEEIEKNYKINEYANRVRHNKKTMKAFEKRAGSAGFVNMLLSGTAGVGMGLAGVGIPDIPVFTGMVLKAVYEIALNYGFPYDTEEERRFILLIIEGAVSYGSRMDEVNGDVDAYIETEEMPADYDEKTQIARAAAGLSKELLYMKFLQGIPIVGAVGGIYDAVYMKRITEYANMKYKKRFMTRMRNS